MSIIVKKLSTKDFIFAKTNYNKPILLHRFYEEKYFSIIKKPNPKNCSNSFGYDNILDIRKDTSKFQFYRETTNSGNLKQIARFKQGKSIILYAYFKDDLYEIKTGYAENDYSNDELELLIKEKIYRNNKKFELIKKQVEVYEKLENQLTIKRREPIPESIRFEVWRRDEGKCVMCGSQKNLEFDHIIPISKGGANTARNIQLLCQDCNRHKSDKI